MKSDSLFVNTSRAELIKPGALKEALKSGRPGRAALDVFENEPIYDKNFWALKMDNVICTPHLGYVEKRGYEYYFGIAFQNVVDYFGGNPTNILNPEALK
jgi:D-3-phosphoglycerate dehydrogenase